MATHPSRQRIAGGQSKEVDVEALIAISIGFPVDSLTEEEMEPNVVSTIGGTEQANYIVVRNYILARWRSNVSIWLTRDHAFESIEPSAGLAVLVAARQLVAMGFKVVVLEGRARPGGRVKARKIKGDEWWLQQMLVGVFLLESMGTRLEFLQGNWVYHVIRLAMIEEVKSVDVNLGTALEAFRHALKVAKDSQERMLLNWHLANLEYANASLMSNLSMAYWDHDPYEMGGDHCFIPGGNDTFEAMSPVESFRVLEIAGYFSIQKGFLFQIQFRASSSLYPLGKDCFTYGSYSYAAVGSLGDDYDILAESIGDGRKQAIELSELDDDVKRMEMLYHNFQVRLVARKGLSDDGDSLIMHIKASRSSLSVGI
ncbi:hypothetical protein GH714_033274 [Hevea brasiliensis]|uniref:Uncharacterized protein n=1 Tax=Hevea brasiliensis TaxID=3981 RepID=A0A6A6LPI9_HEVBR|nr:hypothetical protein GH714_033274 [Hevea brasiliensis]